MPVRPAIVATGLASMGALFELIFPPRSDRTLPRRECTWVNLATDLGTEEEEIRMTNVGAGVTTIDGVGVIIGGDNFLEDRTGTGAGSQVLPWLKKRRKYKSVDAEKREIKIVPNSFYGHKDHSPSPLINIVTFPVIRRGDR